MIFKQNSPLVPSRKSYGIALVFVFIAVMGIIMTISSFSRISEPNQGNPPDSKEKKVETTFESNYPRFVIKTIIITCAIIILFVLGAKLYKRRHRSEISGRIKMDIVGRKYIDSKHYLLMVNVCGQRLLLGVSDNSINLIAEYEDSNSNENFDEANTSQMDDQFSRILKRVKVKDKDQKKR